MYAMMSCSLQRSGVAYGYHTVGICMPFTFYLALPLLQMDVACFIRYNGRIGFIG